MIQNVPTADDFNDAAADFLNLGWDLLASLVEIEALLEIGDAGHGWVDDEEHARRNQRKLAMAALLLVQAVELALKARVAAVSPFLLLEDPSRGSSKSYGELITISAQDLPRLCDAVCLTPLPDQFTQRLSLARDRRNKIAHTTDRTLTLTFRDLICDFFFFVDELYGDQSWKEMRREWVQNDPLDNLGRRSFAEYSFAKEMERILKYLQPAQALRHLGLDTKARRYCCPNCVNVDCGDQPKTAVNIKEANTRQIRCFCCDESAEVLAAEKNCSKCSYTAVVKATQWVGFMCIGCGEAVART